MPTEVHTIHFSPNYKLHQDGILHCASDKGVGKRLSDLIPMSKLSYKYSLPPVACLCTLNNSSHTYVQCVMKCTTGWPLPTWEECYQSTPTPCLIKNKHNTFLGAAAITCPALFLGDREKLHNPVNAEVFTCLCYIFSTLNKHIQLTRFAASTELLQRSVLDISCHGNTSSFNSCAEQEMCT